MSTYERANAVPDTGSRDNTAEPEPLKRRILVCDDSHDTQTSLQKLLEMALPVSVDTVADGGQALESLIKRPYSILVTDLKMPRVSGMQLIQEVQGRRLPVTVIVMTGHGSIDEAVQAMQLGAYDFLTKPPNVKHLCLLVQRALRERELRDELATLRERLDNNYAFHNILTKSPRMYAVLDLIGNVADTTTT